MELAILKMSRRNLELTNDINLASSTTLAIYHAMTIHGGCGQHNPVHVVGDLAALSLI